MRGHIIKRYKDSYTVVLNLGTDPASGKRKQQWISVKGTKKDAEKKLAELLHQIDTGLFMKPGKTTLADFLDRWLSEHVRPNTAPKTYEIRAQQVTRHIIPALGRITLTSLKPDHLQRFYTEKLTSGRIDGKGALSARTVRDLHGILHAALQTAVKRGLLIHNVADAVDPPHFERHEMHTLNEDGLKTVLEAARGTPYYALFYLDLFSGMRRSELLALRWSDADLAIGQVSVNRAMHQLRTGEVVFRQPKTAKSRRLIPLSQSARLVLRQHHDNEEALKESLKGDDLIFSQVDGSPLHPDTVTHVWIRLVRRCGFWGVRLHDCRHTHASLMLKQGIHPKIVQERLGHSTIQITLDTYSHVAPGLQEAAAAKFDDLLLPKQSDRATESVR